MGPSSPLQHPSLPQITDIRPTADLTNAHPLQPSPMDLQLLSLNGIVLVVDMPQLRHL